MPEFGLDPKLQMTIYKTMVDENKIQLLEMSLRHDAMIINLPDAISDDLYELLNNYLKQLRSTLTACEELRIAIDKKFTELE
jgi:hypothetical protein